MSTQRPVLFLAFANSATQPLPQLTEEDQRLRDLLHKRAVQAGHFHLHRESNADLNSLRRYLSEYRDQLWLFHYAGHATSEQIMLSSGVAQADGIAAMLAEQSMLQLVFLNGCATQAQVGELLRLGVPAVIATHSPINDTLARDFSWHFYHSLEVGATISEAFHAAASFVQSAARPRPVLRSLVWEEEAALPAEGSWGLFHHPDRADVLDARLPSGTREEAPADFEPNQLLIQTIWQALVDEGIVSAGRKVKLKRQRMDILNHLPAPIAEHLRKLMVPLGDADEGYNQIGPNRLRQLARCYQVLMELMTFTLLAQLWESHGKQGSLHASLSQGIRDFLHLPAGERATFAFIPFLRQLREALDAQEEGYFVEELADMAELMETDSDFQRACTYFDFLRQRLAQQSDAALQADISRLCYEAEQQLAALFAELGFLAHYTLATVKQIVVQKYRHTLEARFQHIVVRLVDLLGGMDEEEEVFGNFLDSQSVLLLKEDEETDSLPFLNLSPFIIDENAFVDNSDVSKIYFLDHHQAHPSGWAYRWVQRPDDPVLMVPGRDFGLVAEQLEVFWGMWDVGN